MELEEEPGVRVRQLDQYICANHFLQEIYHCLTKEAKSEYQRYLGDQNVEYFSAEGRCHLEAMVKIVRRLYTTAEIDIEYEKRNKMEISESESSEDCPESESSGKVPASTSQQKKKKKKTKKRSVAGAPSTFYSVTASHIGLQCPAGLLYNSPWYSQYCNG